VIKHLWLLTLLGAAPGALAAQDIGLPLGTRAPAITLADVDGKSVDVGRYIGTRPVLLEFWATWCPLCKALEPSLKAAHARYGDRVQFFGIAVAVNESPHTIERHLADHPLPFPMLWDADGAAVRAYQAPTTSYIVVVDKTGKVAYTGSGEDQNIAAVLETVTGK